MNSEITEISIKLNVRQCEKLIKEISTLDNEKYDILFDLQDCIKNTYK